MAAEAATDEDYTQAPGYWADDYWASLREEEKWAGIPGTSRYQVSTWGRYRNLDFTVNGRFYPSKILALNPNNDGYLSARYPDDEGTRQRQTISSLVLTVFDKPRPSGDMQACHLKDIREHNWLSSLEWGTDLDNRRQRQRNSPPAPKPAREPRICVRCGKGKVTTNGKRCTPCVVELGVKAAPLLRKRHGDSTEVARLLDYPSADGIITLATRYGGYGQSLPRRWLRTAITTLRHPFGRGGGDRT